MQGKIPCRILIGHPPASRILEILYHEYSSCRALTCIEVGFFLKHATELIESTSERQQLLAALGLQYKPYYIARMLDLVSLESPLQLALFTGTLTENVARDLLRLSIEDRDAMFALFRQLQIGGGKQRRILALMRDLAGRQSMTLRNYMKGESVQMILEHKEMNTPQKAHMLLQYLQAEHTPTLRKAEEEFEGWRNDLRLPQNCTIDPSPAFEKDSVSLSITFDNRTLLAESLLKIKKIIEK